METFDQLIAATDWEKVEGVAGPAAQVPQLLRTLQSSDEEKRTHAFQALMDTLYEQGSVVEATGHVIAPLIAQLDMPGFSGTVETVELLSFFSAGTGALSAHEHLSVIRDMYAPEVLTQKIAEEKKTLAQIHDEFVKGLPTLQTLLKHPRPEVRDRAKQILGRLGQ